MHISQAFQKRISFSTDCATVVLQHGHYTHEETWAVSGQLIFAEIYFNSFEIEKVRGVWISISKLSTFPVSMVSPTSPPYLLSSTSLPQMRVYGNGMEATGFFKCTFVLKCTSISCDKKVTFLWKSKHPNGPKLLKAVEKKRSARTWEVTEMVKINLLVGLSADIVICGEQTVTYVLIFY